MSADRIILVTGSTQGLGRRVVEGLAQPGTRILVHGRNASRGAKVVSALQREGASAIFLEADLASLEEARRLADAVHKECTHLDVLINNAGISKPDGPRRESVDGFEMHFAINYLASFLLTERLLPLLRAGAGPSHIVHVASAGQSPIDFDDVMLEQGYHGFRAYGQSKVAQSMHTLDLAEALDPHEVVANALHPGTNMDTAMVRDAGISPSGSVDAGAAAVIALATGEGQTATSGRYFNGQHEARATAQVYDAAARDRLRALSRKMTGLA